MSDSQNDAPDLVVLKAVQNWSASGRAVWLATVVETYGSAPRPVGAMAAIDSGGRIVGSVSGGCIEDDLSDYLLRDSLQCSTGKLFVYGRDGDERSRLRLPCNGNIKIWLEPVQIEPVRQLLEGCEAGLLMVRQIDMATGSSFVSVATPGERCVMEDGVFRHVLGPVARLVLIGASEVSRYLAPIAKTLGFEVTVVDPREEYVQTWPHAECTVLQAMPDDVLAANPPDVRTAVVALSHDPKIDDLALMEALKSEAFYVGAMGSVRTTDARKRRLQMFDVTEEEVDRLRGPVGVSIGARTPPEIAVSVAAELVSSLRTTLGASSLECASGVVAS